MKDPRFHFHAWGGTPFHPRLRSSGAQDRTPLEAHQPKSPSFAEDQSPSPVCIELPLPEAQSKQMNLAPLS
jgi:hypothetical protein